MKLLSKLNITQKGLVLVLVPLALELAFVLTLGWLLNSAVQELSLVDHCADGLLAWNRETSTYLLGMLDVRDIKDQTREEQLKFVDGFLANATSPSVWRLPPDIESFPELDELIAEAKVLNKTCLENFQAIRKKLENPDLTPLQRQQAFTHNMGSVQMLLSMDYLDHKFVNEEKKFIGGIPRRIEQVRRVLLLLSIVGLIISCTLSIVFSRLFSREITQRLLQLCDHATLLSAGKELPVIDEINDELGALEKVLYNTSVAMAESRRKELAVLENAEDILCSIDDKQKFIDVGQSSTSIWKRPPEDLAGASVMSIVSSDTAEVTRQALEQAFQKSDHPEECTFENVIISGDGKGRNCLWRIIYSPEAHCLYCVIHDITDLRATENLKRLFLSMVSHDLRAPLQSIGLSLSALLDGRRGELPGQVQTLLKRAQADTSGVIQLANTLLEFDKLMSTKPSLMIEALSADELANTAIDSVRSLAERYDVQLEEPTGDAAILVDETRLLQALVTLLSTAVKYAVPGAHLDLQISHRDLFCKFRITVSDSTIDTSERTAFSSLLTDQKNEAVPPVRGAGLSLAIAKAIVENHGGAIGIGEMAESNSLTFWFTVPELLDDEP